MEVVVEAMEEVGATDVSKDGGEEYEVSHSR